MIDNSRDSYKIGKIQAESSEFIGLFAFGFEFDQGVSYARREINARR